VPSENIIQEFISKGYSFTNPAFAGYLPSCLYELREKATLISLAKIKSQFHDPTVGFSGTIKNVFGLIPDPSRFKYHTSQDMRGLDTALADIFLIYACLFRESRWIAEGIYSFTKEPFSPNPTIVMNQHIMFLGKNPIKVDADICEFFGIGPESSDYFRHIKNLAIQLKLFKE
jgi:uncharacterized protein (DUF362 family)